MQGVKGLRFAVSDEKNRWLEAKMAELGVREEEIEETFIRSSGAGGQHVNKSATCVRVRHIPSGIEVKCMTERSQSLNRFLARRELLERLEAEAGGQTKRDRDAEKIRKRKASRRRKSTEKYGTKTKADE